MQEKVKISKEGHITIPKKVRSSLGLETGDELSINVRDNKIILRKKPKSYTDYMYGLHSEAWKGIDPTEYVEKERAAWQKTG